MPGLKRTWILLLLALESAHSAHAQDERSAADVSSAASAVSQPPAVSTPGSSQTAIANATCHSRTVNYITHTLPQQCLRTNRASSSTASELNGTSESDAAISTSSSTLPESGGVAESAVPTAETSHSGTNTTTPGPHDASTQTHTSSTSTTTVVNEPSATAQDIEAETDSPLDNANFLSFEDWKRQNLVKAGQSPENLGARSQALEGERKRPGINNALDTLGEESEIELDFSGFGASRDNPDERSASGTSDTASSQSSLAHQTTRSKDAGKTCKERTNYASFDCAATILKNNPESKSGSSVLVENKDSYMLNKCSAQNKFVIVELCNDILVDTIVLANYEFFSSIFRHFRISVSDRYPVKMEKWKDLGTFEARNTREVQAFLIENPLIWARYLRIEFLTHYGNEYFCPVSLLRVHGTTMMDEFRHQEEIARGDVHDDEVTIEPEVTAQSTIQQEPSSASPEVDESTVQTIADTKSSAPESAQDAQPTFNASEADQAVSDDTHDKAERCPVATSTVLPLIFDYPSCKIQDGPSDPAATTTSSTPTATSTPNIYQESSPSTPTTPDVSTDSGSASQKTTVPESPRSSTASSASASNAANNAGNKASTAHSASDPLSSSPSTSLPPSPSTGSTMVAPPISRSREESTSTSHTKITASTHDSSRQASSNTSPQPAQPSTQESFFKSVHKRLQQLESNSTLSLQYIEEQSRILRDAFSKVEKRQVTSTTNFLSHLNATVMGELQGFRQAYDQLWQSTVIELEGQREQYQREMLALSTRLTLVADELVWQKRMGIVQSTLLLLCLALVLFNRASSSALVEMPLLQQMMNKSQAALRAGWESPTGSRSPDNHSPDNRSPDNRSPVSLFRKKLWRHQTEPVSGHTTDATDSRPQSRDAAYIGPDVHVEAPTPPRVDRVVESEDEDEDEGEWAEVPEVQSGPATPRGTRESAGSTWLEEGARPSSSLG